MRVRLFCFPYAGGSEFMFYRWSQVLGPTIEVHPVRLPGRGSRLVEAPFSRLHALITSTVSELVPYLDQPYALFGHSMGALISFELARAVRRLGLSEPIHLFASAHRAPQLPLTNPAIHHLPDDEFLAELRGYNGTPEEALLSTELMGMLLPLLRADFELCHTYEYIPERPLDCAITAVGGVADLNVSRTELQAWQEQSTGTFHIHQFPGDHFYIRQFEGTVLELIRKRLMGYC